MFEKCFLENQFNVKKLNNTKVINIKLVYMKELTELLSRERPYKGRPRLKHFYSFDFHSHNTFYQQLCYYY